MKMLLRLTFLHTFLACQLWSQTPGNPILFVTQVPTHSDSSSIVSTFANHLGGLQNVPRGGDLYIRYPNATLKNLTQLAGYGSDSFQGANAIAVRDPHVHWSGQKAIFSMLIGASSERYERGEYYWQLYEIIGLGINDTPVITPVTHQPLNYNNVNPIYGTDDRIIFTTDRPRSGERHLYPQLDEYEEFPSVTGLWSLDPVSGDLFLMEHSPSGSFDPIIDSYGRVIFTRWDHLQRDQQADGDALNVDGAKGTFDYSDESAQADALFDVRVEIFPEPLPFRTDLLAGTNQVAHRFNLFFPWMIEEDGTNMETLNHVGRHELHNFFERNINDDNNVIPFVFNPNIRVNQNELRNIFHIREDPLTPGLYYGTDAPEFQTHTSGQILTISGQPTLNPEQMLVDYITHPDTRNVSGSLPPTPDHSGLYRDPLPTSDGFLIAAHTAETNAESKSPPSIYDYRLKMLSKVGVYWTASTPLTSGITKSITYWSPDVSISYQGELWELQPVEVVARSIPQRAPHHLESQETGFFVSNNISMARFKQFLADNELALIVMRDVTTRDDIDKQQPYNLKVSDEITETIGASGTVYDVKYLQILQADLLRGLGLRNPDDTPSPGRRVLARYMHSDKGLNPIEAGAPPGSVKIHSDGSVVAFVPARRALTWQLTDGAGESVVRERYWLSFQPGEIRSCTSCHGVNDHDQAGNIGPQNLPQALDEILQAWKTGIEVRAHITNFTKGIGTSYSFDIIGEPNEAFTLQRSDNLYDWIDIGEYQIPAAPPYMIPIQESFGNGKRYFYRLYKKSELGF